MVITADILKPTFAIFSRDASVKCFVILKASMTNTCPLDILVITKVVTLFSCFVAYYYGPLFSARVRADHEQN